MPEKSTILETSISFSFISSHYCTLRNVHIYRQLQIEVLTDDNQNIYYLALVHIMHMYLC